MVESFWTAVGSDGSSTAALATAVHYLSWEPVRPHGEGGSSQETALGRPFCYRPFVAASPSEIPMQVVVPSVS
jgi:hypothetical protein